MLVQDVCVDAAGSVSAQVAQRWQVLDPLLPVPRDRPAGCGLQLAVSGPGGQPEALAGCEHWQGMAGSLNMSWGAARRFRLAARVAGPDVGGALDELLSRWRDHLAQVPDSGAEDTAAVVTWPSRDVGGVAALQRHGLTPLAVFAARAGARPPAPGHAGRAVERAPSVRIRRAAAGDIDAVVRLGLETIRFDAHFGGVVERPETEDALRCEATGLLAGPEPWTWLAEREGTPVGVLCAQQPEATRWIAPMTRAAPVAYILLMAVEAAERGGGIGAALATRAHREIDAAGVAVTLLHYSQPNPLSVPFWSAQGYRPLWTFWEARPARALR